LRITYGPLTTRKCMGDFILFKIILDNRHLYIPNLTKKLFIKQLGYMSQIYTIQQK